MFSITGIFSVSEFNKELLVEFRKLYTQQLQLFLSHRIPIYGPQKLNQTYSV